MIKNIRHILFFSLAMFAIPAMARDRVYHASSFGIVPNTAKSQSAAMAKALETIRSEMEKGDKATLVLGEGRYDFHPGDAAKREYYVSNHDQNQPKCVGIPVEDMHDFVLDGQGAELVFHGSMMPLSLVRSTKCALRNFSIDFDNPHITQITITENSAENGISFRPAPWVRYKINADRNFIATGDDWTNRPQWGIAFEGDTRHIGYGTSDLSCPISNVIPQEDGSLRVPGWKDARLKPGTVIALRGWGRPAPGIFMSHSLKTKLYNVRVHYAEGMGLMAQMCEDITLDGFGVCLKGKDDPRYFTTQADATHFSGCRGKIVSVNGLYEGMMDDAINVHGTYLKVVKRVDDYSLEARYMHHQSWGFDWGYEGDKVQFVRSSTMELLEQQNEIAGITALDPSPTASSEGMNGVHIYRLSFKKPLPEEINGKEGYGIENLNWTPEVRFAGNTVRNNRARGALFSTPRKVVAEDNIFDHTSGCAILLCGDCNGWYETGACRDVTIRRNHFINALTSQFQFTSAIISIYPEIPNLAGQKKLFHGGKKKNAIRIEDNVFETFDAPILYAKSVDGLLFRGNKLYKNTDYPPMHWNKNSFFLQNVRNVDIKNVLYDHSGLILKEVKMNMFPTERQ